MVIPKYLVYTMVLNSFHIRIPSVPCVTIMHVQKTMVKKKIIGRIIKIHPSCGSRIPRIYQAANNSYVLFCSASLEFLELSSAWNLFCAGF